jgi:hypothetical protein
MFRNSAEVRSYCVRTKRQRVSVNRPGLDTGVGVDTGKIGPAPGEAIVPAPFQVANGPVIRFQRSSSLVHAKLKLCSNTVPVQFQLRSRRAGETGSPFLHHLAVSIWPSLGIKRTRMTPSACGMMPRCKRRIFPYALTESCSSLT